MIFEIFCSGPVETNTILLGCEKTGLAAVIDVPFESTDTILAHIQAHSLTIHTILLTHSHWDHIAEVAILKERTGAQLLVHAEDAENLRDPGSDGLPLFLPVKAAEPDDYLFDGQRILVGEIELQVIHTPGHTPGCVCFYIEKEGILISGDTLFRGTIGNLSFPTARPELMWTSLARLAKLPADTRVYPGHGDPTTIGAEKWLSHAQEKFGDFE